MSRSALITSAGDVGALSVTLIVSYIGSKSQYNKVRDRFIEVKVTVLHIACLLMRSMSLNIKVRDRIMYVKITKQRDVSKFY